MSKGFLGQRCEYLWKQEFLHIEVDFYKQDFVPWIRMEKQAHIDRSDVRITPVSLNHSLAVSSRDGPGKAYRSIRTSRNSACPPPQPDLAPNDRKQQQKARKLPIDWCVACRYTSNSSLIGSPLDGGGSGLPALYILNEGFSRLQFDLNSEEEIRPCNHCDLIIGSGLGA
jgi:hypothetical protein